MHIARPKKRILQGQGHSQAITIHQLHGYVRGQHAQAAGKYVTRIESADMAETGHRKTHGY